MIGGSLSRPAERFPSLLGNNEFLKEFPYFLPCAVPATYTMVVWFVTFLFLKEVRDSRAILLLDGVNISQYTHPSPTSVREFLCGDKKRVALEEDPLLASEPTLQNELEKPVPLGNLCLMRDMLVTSANHALLALVGISFCALQPVFLFLSTPSRSAALDSILRRSGP